MNTAKVEDLQSKRILSIDAFRGITIAGMILVNIEGRLPEVYYPLRHAKWNGWTPADLVFPFFLFIVGVVIPISFMNRLEHGDSRKTIYLHILRRSVIIFGLGVFLNTFPYWNYLSTRIPGVLQRIALCYLFTSLIFLKLRLRGQVIAASALLIIYWLLMELMPVPGYGSGVLTVQGNFASYIDRLLLSGHLIDPGFDPEGVLGTMTATATTLMGVFTGRILISSRKSIQKIRTLLIIGITAVLSGMIVDVWFPINKNLWTSSYAVFTAGIAIICIAVSYWIIDVRGCRRWSVPFIVYGSNAITVYVLSSMVERMMLAKKLTLSDGSVIQLQTHIYDKFFLSWSSPANASLFYALVHVVIWLGFAAILYRKRIFIKI